MSHKNPKDKELYLGINESKKLSREASTPFYIFFQSRVEKNYVTILESLSSLKDVGIYYSIKTNYETLVLETINRLKAGFDISVQFDLEIARKHRIDYSRLVIDNSHDIHSGLEEAICKDVHMVNIDSYDEAERISSLAARFNKTVNLGIRLDLSPDHLDMIRWPLEVCRKRFGLACDSTLDELARRIKQLKNVRLVGLFTHLGLPFPVPDDYARALKKMFSLAYRFRKNGINIEELNIGGGYPDPEEVYFNKIPLFLKKAFFVGGLEKQIKSDFFSEISRCYAEESRAFNIKPRLALEPGNVLVNNSGVITGRVIRRYKNQVICDISTNDLGFHFPFISRRFLFPDRIGERLKYKTNIVGPTCNPYDVLYRNVLIPDVKVNDVIIIYNAGAYCLGRSIQHARPRRPAYFVDSSGKISLIRREENFNDVIGTQIFSGVNSNEYIF